MSDKCTVTTRSKLRKLQAELNKRRVMEVDSGVPSEMAPGSPSIAPTISSVPAPVIPLAGPGRVIDHRETVTPVRSEKPQKARSRTSHVSSRSGQRSVDYLRRRVEYEAERELVRLKENLVRKKLEADLAEIDAAADEDSSDEEITARRVEDWVTNTTPVVNSEGPAPAQCRDPTPPRPAPTPEAAREVTANIPPPPQSDRASALPQCAPASVQFREPEISTTPAVTFSAHAPTSGRNGWDNAFTDESEKNKPRDRRIDQLADAISNLARPPRPVPRQAYELPIFNGDPAEWLSYKNMYHDTTALYQFKPHENLARLKTSLQGDAKLAVEDLLRCSTNPSEILKTLDEEFGHPNLVLECTLRKIRALPKVTDSGRELRQFSTTVRNCVSLLRSVRANGYLNNPQLVSEILNKLTPIQRAQYGDFAMGMASSQGIDVRVSPSLEILAEFLTHLARATSYYAQMNVDMPTAQNSASKPRGQMQFVRQGKNIQRLHVHTEGEQQDSTNEEKCTLCSQQHKLTNCEKFGGLSVDERWRHVKQHRLCFKCIVRKHNKNVCRASKCTSCNYAHHVMLHADKKTESVTNVSEYTGKALLKIMPVCVTVSGVEKQCYALLDDGATVSLIDESLADDASGKRVPLVLRTARGQEIQDEASRVISVSVRGPNGQTHKVKCRTLKRLDLPAQTVPTAVMTDNAHIRHLGCEEMWGARPLLLLGQDNWELLVSRETRRGKSAAISAVAGGTILAWTSPALPQLQPFNNVTVVNGSTSNVLTSIPANYNGSINFLGQPADFLLNTKESSLVSSILAIGAALSALPVGMLANKVGRRPTVLLLAIPFLINWLLTIFANGAGMLIAARFFAGLATGGACVAAPMYIGEIAETSIRGSLGAFFQLFLTVGILFTFVVGGWTTWKTLSIISAVFPVLLVAVFWWMPETPQYLLGKNRRRDAEKSLRWLRGPNADLTLELEEMQKDVDDAARQRSGMMSMVTNKASRMALICGLGLMFFQQFSGINAVIFYTNNIFISAGSDIPPTIATIIVGVVQTVATYISSVCVDKAGRRILLLQSTAIMGICLIILGIYFKLQQDSTGASFGWIPLVCLILFVISFSMGFGPIPWMMMAELFPVEFRGAATGVTVIVNWMLVFIVTLCFPIMKDAIGIFSCFWFFAAFMIIGTIFVFFLIPETKGKTVSQIQAILAGKK